MYVFPKNMNAFFLFYLWLPCNISRPFPRGRSQAWKEYLDMYKPWSELLAWLLEGHLSTCPFLAPSIAGGSPRAPLGLPHQLRWHQPHHIIPGSLTTLHLQVTYVLLLKAAPTLKRISTQVWPLIKWKTRLSQMPQLLFSSVHEGS